MNETKIELSNKLKELNKKSQKWDEKQLREQYQQVIGRNIDIDTALRVYYLCPRLEDYLREDADRICGECWRILQTVSTSGSAILQHEQHVIMVAVKMLLHLWKVGQHNPSSSEAEQALLRLLDHPGIQVEVALVVGAAVTKIPVKEESDSAELRHKYKKLLMSREQGSFASVCLSEGIIGAASNLDTEVLISKDEDTEETLLDEVSSIILKACSLPSPYSFQSFQSLKRLSSLLSSLSRRDTCPKTLPNLNPKSEIGQKMLGCLNSNWENPTKGVSDLISSTMSSLLDAYKSSGYDSVIREDIFENTWESFSWRSKPKYALLSVLFPVLGPIEKTLDDHPEIGVNMGESLVSNYLASAGAAVYKIMVKNVDFKCWERHLKLTLIEGLMSDQDLVATNACNHWLAATVRAYKNEAVSTLLADLNKSDCDRSWTAAMLVLKASKQCGLEDFPSAQEHLHRALRHFSCKVRSAAFSALCLTKKRGTPPTLEEMDLITDFVRHNLAVDSPAFRQNFLGDLSVVLIRCRDYLVCEIRKWNKTKTKDANYAGLDLVKKLDSLLELLFANCFPGANYQRLNTSLEALELLSTCFFHFRPGVGVNKASGNGDPAPLLEYCNKMGLFQFATERHYDVLFSCVLHHMADVRLGALRLLEKLPSPRKEVTLSVLQKGLELACSPKFAECESGAALLGLVSRWVVDKKEAFEQYNFKVEIFRQSLIAKSTVCETLMTAYEKLLDKTESEFLLLAKKCPLHGILTAVRSCLERESEQISKDFGQKAARTLRRSCDIMMSRLSVKDAFADFSDMAEAVEAICETESSGVEISDEHQLVLACAWLNLKECCLLSNCLVKQYKSEMSVQEVEMCCNIIMEVLTRCRHKGAIIAAQNSMQEISSSLLQSSKEVLRRIPESILTKTLDHLEEKLSGASATRRSAGLPMLVLKLVSGEAKGSSRMSLTSLAIARLCKIAEKDLSSDADEIKDAPQAHALHILRALVHDAGLSGETSPHVHDILKSCVVNFGSRLWAVRNAALQLFGALAPRMLGQKKVKDEGSACNSLTTAEFLSRHSRSVPFILQHLKYDVTSKDRLANPALVPLLSILCRLMPSKQDQDREIENDFKSAFFPLLSCPVINVRVLAAKAFAAFTDESDAKVEMEAVLERLQRVDSANFANGLLHVALQLADSKLCVNSETMKAVQEYHFKNFAQCYENKVLIHKITVKLGLEFKAAMIGDKVEGIGHPGYVRWIALSNCDRRDKSATSQEVSDISNKSPAELVSYLTDHLEDNEEVSLQMAGKCLETICEAVGSENVLEDAEVALDLLDLATDERLASKNEFSSASSSSLKATALAFASMLVQPDWDMFFGKDESPYVSRFVEFTERLVRHSTPYPDKDGGSADEDCRFAAAMALRALLPMFRNHRVRDMPPVMRYGFVNLSNACLELLTDEEEEVRSAATEVASKWAVTTSKSSTPSELLLPTTLATEKFVMFGLKEFCDCANWSEAVVEVLMAPWRDDFKAVLEKALQRQYLFESGDGVNVYAEKFRNNFVYHKVIRKYLSDQTSPEFPRLSLNLEQAAFNAQHLLDLSKKQMHLTFSQLWSPLGYLLLTRICNFLDLACNFGDVLCLDKDAIVKLKLVQLKDELDQCLMHRNM